MGQTLAATAQERFSEPKTKHFLPLAANESVDPEARSSNQNHISTIQLLILIKREKKIMGLSHFSLTLVQKREQPIWELGAGKEALQSPLLYLIKEEPGLAYRQ